MRGEINANKKKEKNDILVLISMLMVNEKIIKKVDSLTKKSYGNCWKNYFSLK